MSVTVKAAWISGTLAVVAGVLGALIISYTNKQPDLAANGTSQTVVGAGNVTIGGDATGARITLEAKGGPEEGLTPRRRKIVNEILESIDRWAASKGGHPSQSLWAQVGQPELFAEVLAKDPYNTRALLHQAIFQVVDSRRTGGSGLGDALAGFEKVSEIDPELGDANIGTGLVLYHLAMFDIAQRGTYEVAEKGRIALPEGAAVPQILPPLVRIPFDNRTREVLVAALEEFQIGRKKRASYSQTESATLITFAPRDTEVRIHSLRELLGYDPVSGRETDVAMMLTGYVTHPHPDGVEAMIEIVK